ncbi:Multidrug resistance-associated protein 4 [Sarcoptes scabiei]|uniref:Multidrug resistance-associated protein 4 n=1 Tax=Sarcoptes scabiei TaxID=52283 RepID=A0A834R7R2_SARSC|nr:Multidrug resistance-associated protein 4 [Sarcoptes scabiei]
MEYCKLIIKDNPYDRAGLINRNFFCWIIPLLNAGYRKELEPGDLWRNSKCDSSEMLGARLQEEWNKELKKKKHSKPSFLKAIIRAFGFWYFMAGLLSILSDAILRVLQPIIMGWMIYFLQKYRSSQNEEDLYYFFYCGIAVVVLGVIYVIVYHPYFFKMTRKGMQLRIACCNMIYRKALRLSHKALGQTTVGQMVNLLSNDVNRFDYAFIFVPYIVTAPVQAIITIVYLYYFDFNWSVFVGCSVLILYLPFQMYMGSLFSKLRAKTAILTDERIRLMNELIPAMRVIKMYTWEKPFAKLVELARRREVSAIRKTALLRGVNMALFFVSSKVIVFVCFVVFILEGGTFSPQHVFVAIALFGNFRTCLTLFFPYGVSQGSEAIISITRLEQFLLLEEKQIDSDHIDKISLPIKPKDAGVWMKNVFATWDTRNQEPTLGDLNFEINSGELLVIIGSVGSGKSSVLMSILSEIPIYSGTLKVRGKISYASQQPWNFAGTVRENVLFGNPYNETRYKKVLHVCALEKDLELFQFGDQTIVGDRGVSLSGGQKARINLARALYEEAEVYLLDDPLSAVDAAVSKHIFEKCIRGFLKHKTVILVTHQLQFIRQATKILVLNNGKTQGYGTYSELMNSGIDFVKIANEEKLAQQQKLQDIDSSIRQSMESLHTTLHHSSQLSLNSSIGGDDLTNFITGEALQQTNSEMLTSGSVKARIYWVYVRMGAGFFFLSLLIISNIGTQLLFNGSDYFLALWTDHESGVQNMISSFSRETCIIILSVLVGVLFILSLVRTTTFFTICMRSSINLHNSLFECLIRAPITFFDNNPIGVLLNRCSRDMGIVDDQIPPTAFDAIEIFVQMIGILVLVSFISYWIIIPTLVLAVIFYYIRNYYIISARSIKRLEGITRSPVFSHLANSLYGLATVRAFGVQSTFEKKFDEYQDCHTASWFLFISAARWFGIVLDWLCVIYLAAVTLALSLTHSTKTPSEIGLSISYAITLTGMFQWGVRQSAELESQMTSVERVDEFSHIENEKNLELSVEQKPPEFWPEAGRITFENVSLAYAPDAQPVLKELNFEIKAREKIGIVGRTGAGKSSMISSLFRLLQPTGRILIDKIDTNTISLTELRKKLSIIPQDPIIFAGPVRRNIDPFNQHSDQRLWQVLEEVQLKDVVMEMAGGLDSNISEGGSNLSVGQRQLFCLARAILKQNRILILDEATANVDHKTDLFIQDAIRDKFAYCTVLTIAHRLHTIMDSDRVLVLDAGKIIEFDEPYALLQNEKGLFYNMVRMTGKSMANNLKEMARIAHEMRLKQNINFDRAQLRTLQGSFIHNPRTDSIAEENSDEEKEAIYYDGNGKRN